ncbi:MAG: hypothetical protein QOH49_1510 [Acidobacteriota bacterium]|jgi:hypothetical protein|nr:hypothetical protein [Acidobacteriota bacterium]
MQSFDYQVCSVQYGRVTFVNGAWRGRTPMSEDTSTSLESCPNVWDYLQEAGRDGWELVAVVTHQQPQPEAVQDTLYLKRPSW